MDADDRTEKPSLLSRFAAWRRRHATATFVGGSALLYVAAYPLWLHVSPVYNRLLTAAYDTLAPVVEHPRLTDSLTWVGTDLEKPRRHITSWAIKTGGTSFSVQYLYGIDIALFLALLPFTPSLSVRKRLRMAAIALPIFMASHLIALALTVREVYAGAPLVRADLHPGRMSVAVNHAVRSVFMSEWSLALPIVLWGVLFLWERQDPAVGSETPAG